MSLKATGSGNYESPCSSSSDTDICHITQDGDEDERRRHQMLQLRRHCLPPLCLLLHQVLHTTKRYKECVQIADCVTDEQHQLYKVS